jgi:hypothetical protein
MAWAEAGRRLARERNRREAAGAIDLQVARADWRRLQRAGGGEWARFCDGSAVGQEHDESCQCFFAR